MCLLPRTTNLQTYYTLLRGQQHASVNLDADLLPETVPRYNGRAISTRYSGAAIVAMAAKELSKNRPPINVPTTCQA